MSEFLTHAVHQGDPGPADDPLSISRAKCPVELQGEGQPIRVNGRLVAGVVGVTYRALQALCGAFPGGLTRQQLNDAAGSKDARRALQYLEKVDPWKSARVLASDRGAGKCPAVYRLVAFRTIWGWPVRAEPPPAGTKRASGPGSPGQDQQSPRMAPR